MFLLRYYRFQITEVTFVMHYPFRNIYYDMREQAKRASAQNHHTFSFLRNPRLLQNNISFISQYTLFFEWYRCYSQVPVQRQTLPFFGHCQINYFGISLLFFKYLDMFNTTFLIIVILLLYILSLCYICNSMHLHFILPHWNINNSLTDKRSISRKSTCQRASRSSELGNYSHLQVPKLLYLSMFELVIYLRIILWHVSRLLCYIYIHSLQFPFYILLMTWHYKRLTSYQQNTHIEIIYSMRARKIYAFLHFKPAI